MVHPLLPLRDLWPQQCITLWSGVLRTTFGRHRAFLAIWPLVDPGWPVHGQDFFLPNLVFHSILEQFDTCMTPVDLCIIFNPINALHFCQGLFPANLLTIEHSRAFWPLIDPGWPTNALHFDQGFLVAKGHFFSNLTSGCPLTFGRFTSRSWPQTSKAHSLPPHQVSAECIETLRDA